MTSFIEFTNAFHQAHRFPAEGELLTVPALYGSDGAGLIWVADVRISGYSDRLRNVPLAAGGRDLVAAGVGQAVQVAKREGVFEIIGYSKRKPGTRVRVPVNLLTGISGAAIDDTLTARPLTFEELSTIGGGFGIAAFGSIGIFLAGVLQEVR